MRTTTTDRITKVAGVCGGRASVAGHRIPIWGLVRYRQLGLSDSKILEAYPSIEAADLEAAWEHYAIHRDEIDRGNRDNDGDQGD